MSFFSLKIGSFYHLVFLMRSFRSALNGHDVVIEYETSDCVATVTEVSGKM